MACGMFEVGDRVFGLARRGALAEEIIAPAAGLLKIPDHITFAQAAAIPGNYLTSMFALKEIAGVREGETGTRSRCSRRHRQCGHQGR